MSSPRATTTTTNPLVPVLILCLGGLSAALTQTVVIPIQSELPGYLGTSADNTAWVITVTLLAGAVAMPVAGRLGDLFGKQRVLAVSAAILVLGSVVCALSDSLVLMLTGRMLQGLAMGFIPVGISLMREITPPAMTATAIAAMSATLGVGGAIGLPLSAWIADAHDWHALFWVATGLALVTLAAVVLLVPHVPDANPGRVDFVGALGLAAGLVAFLIGISKANTWGWADPKTLGCIVGGLLVLALWGWFELGHAEPLVDLRTTAQLPVLMTNIAAVAIGFGMMAQSVVVPQLLQLPESTGFGLGQSMLHAGLWMAPGGLMMLAFAPLTSMLIKKYGAKLTLMLGAAVLGLGYLVAFGMMDAAWQLLVASCVSSAGVGIGYAAMPTLIMDNVPMREAGAAVGLNSLMRSVGTTLASAVMAAVLTGSVTASGMPTERAFQLCFLIGAAAAFLGVLIGATIPRNRDASLEPVSLEEPSTVRA
ncbi:MFS transporter [Nocardioides sp. W7]|uniref:MFS transporter n=1 Tax=Nocardioides sp. W7 TaxID=2931390 RepID=UPI001FD4AAC6|nr:MFS transporter [Nocardioides sp. W7]